MPPGGALSPLLWLLHFNAAQPRLTELRAGEPEFFGQVACVELIYADDVAGALAHRNVEVLLRAVQRNAELILKALGEVGRNLSVPKSLNLFL